MKRYEVTGRGHVTTAAGKQNFQLDQLAVPAADPQSAIHVAVLTVLNGRAVPNDLSTLTWVKSPAYRLLEGEQPPLPIKDPINDITELDPKIIHTDGGTQARAGLTPSKVDEYQERMEAGDSFPPITVYYDGANYWLADGYHRLYAHRSAFRKPGYGGGYTKQIAAHVKQGTRRDAILHACGANAEHGLQRTNEDKVRAVTVLLEDKEWGTWSDREIARRCHVSHPFVAKLREKVNGHTGNVTSMERTYTHPKTGQETTMNTAAIGKSSLLPRIMQIDADIPIQAEFTAPPAPEVAPEKPAQPSNAIGQIANPDDVDQTLYAALVGGTAGARAKWDRYRQIGLTDSELKEVLGQAWGLGHGSHGPGRVGYSCKGGKQPTFWYGHISGSGEKPTLIGGALLRRARALLDIPQRKAGEVTPAPPAAPTPPASPPPPQLDYASVSQLESFVRAWLQSPGLDGLGHDNPLDYLVDIKENRPGHALPWNHLKAELANTGVLFRVAELRQACNNVYDQEWQRQKQQQPVPPPGPSVTVADPLELLAVQLDALDEDNRAHLTDWFKSAATLAFNQRPPARAFVQALADLLAAAAPI